VRYVLPIGLTTFAVPVVTAMSSVAAVHEEVHESTETEQRDWHDPAPQDVHTVLVNEEQGADAQEDEEREARAGAKEAAWTGFRWLIHGRLAAGEVERAQERSSFSPHTIAIFVRFNKAELAITESELSAIAAAARIGLSKPSAAIGTPTPL